MAWAALLVLALGAAGHLRHHLTDPDCESPGARGSSHACAACAAFHGGVLAGHDDVALIPPPRPSSRISLPATEHTVVHECPVGPTRGPPAA